MHSVLCVCWFLGRMYNYHVLDMVELGIEKFTSFSDFKVRGVFKISHS